MGSTYFASFVLLSCLLVFHARADLVVWTKEHLECLLPTRHHDPHHAANRNHTHIAEHCREASYMKTVRKGLTGPKGTFDYQVYEAINSLYVDLAIARQPRKLELSREILLHPITFAIPSEFIVDTLPPKIKPFGQVIPGNKSTYFSLGQDALYRADMSSSLYTLTWKKNGWDCLRHSEILAAGSLPLFTDIDKCPVGALALHPKKLYKLILKTPGLALHYDAEGKPNSMQYSLDAMSEQSRILYSTVNSALLQYTRNVFSTTAMASYVLETIVRHSQGHVNSTRPRSIFYLTHQDHDMDKGDYQVDMVLHGLKKLFGDEAVVDFPRRDCLYKPTSAFVTRDYLEQKNRLYGMGYTIGLNLDAYALNADRNMDDIRQRIVDHKFDLIILGSGHRDGWAAKLHYWHDFVCKHYHPLEVAWIGGSDSATSRKQLDKYAACAGHMFSREGYEG